MKERSMVSIPAVSVDEYLAKLPADRRAVVSAVRDMVKRYLPRGYVERANWGMISYEVPLETSGPTYNGQPLCYAALAAQKQHYSLYLMGPYGDAKLRRQLEDAFVQAGKRLDMGKACVRFKSLDALPLDAIGAVLAAVPMDRYIAFSQRAHAERKTAKATAKGKTAPATTTAKAAKRSRRRA